MIINSTTLARTEFDLLFDADFYHEVPEDRNFKLGNVIEYGKCVDKIDKFQQEKWDNEEEFDSDGEYDKQKDLESMNMLDDEMGRDAQLDR